MTSTALLVDGRIVQPLAHADAQGRVYEHEHNEPRCFADKGYYEQVKSVLDSLEARSLKRLREVLVQARDALISRVTRAAVLPDPRGFRLKGLRDFRIEVRDMLERASARGSMDARREVREGRRATREYGSPDQPRDPAGSPTGGQWSSGDASRVSVSISGGTPEDHATVKQLLRQVPQKALDDSIAKRVVIHAKTPTNPTLIDGEVVGFYRAGTINLYPGWDSNTLYHELGHSLELRHAKRYVHWANRNGVKLRGGYGNQASTQSEGFANAFSAYMRGSGRTYGGYFDPAFNTKKYAFNPGQPRDEQGQWTDTGSVGSGVGSKFSDAPLTGEKAARWRRAMQEHYDNDPEFRAAADAIALYTQGEYANMREIAQQQITGEFTDRYKDSSVPEWRDRMMSGSPLASFKSYFEGQDVGEGSKHTWSEGARALNEAIATSKPLGTNIYRGVYGRENIDGLKAMKPGDDFNIVGPSSFTADEGVATKFSQGVASGQGRRGGGGLAHGVQSAVIEIEAGARGVPVSALSPWKQKEVISSGRFKVVKVTSKEREVYSGGYWSKVNETRIVLRQTEVWKGGKKKTFAARAIKELPLITQIFGESFSEPGEEHDYAAPPAFRPRNAQKWMREKEFYVTDLLDAAITNNVRGILVNGLKTGELNAAVADKIWTAFEAYIGDPSVLRDGEPLSPHRLETIVRTNLTDAYNHGRMMEYTSDEMLPFLNAIRYSAILDERTTECCAFLDGKLFDPIDPDLTDLLPPNHFNCRSIVVPVIVGEVVDEEDFITPEEVGQARMLADTKFLAFNPDQPRAPDGKWTDAGGGASGKIDDAELKVAGELGLPGSYQGRDSKKAFLQWSVNNPLPQSENLDYDEAVRIDVKSRPGTDKVVDISSLRSAQDYIQPTAVDHMMKGNYFRTTPLVVSVNGEMVILNGNHSVLASKLAGKDTIKVTYLGEYIPKGAVNG